MSKENIDILYLCDNMRCANSCHVAECNHTHDLEHAKHKDSLDGRIFEYVDTGENVGLFELDITMTNLGNIHTIRVNSSYEYKRDETNVHKLEQISCKSIEELVELFAAGWTLEPPKEYPSFRDIADSL